MSFRLRLYVTGQSFHSQRALANIRDICEHDLKGRYEIELIDVLEHPELAERERIMATPTLVRRLPQPIRKIIGDFSDREKVLFGLEIASGGASDGAGE